jgi:hypothetical protein
MADILSCLPFDRPAEQEIAMDRFRVLSVMLFALCLVVPGFASPVDEHRSADPVLQETVRYDDVRDSMVVSRDADAGEIKTLVADSPENFEFADLTVTVLDEHGAPVPDAWVKAYSEQWGIRYPADWVVFEWSDSAGQVQFHLPKGDWMVMAGGGYTFMWGRPGEGLFISGHVSLGESTSLVLQPDSSRTITFTDVNNDPLSGAEVLVAVDRLVPLLPFALAGQTGSGTVRLQLSSSESYSLLVLKRPEGASAGYVLHLPHESATGTHEYEADESQLAAVQFEAYDASLAPETLDMGVSLAWLDMDRMHGVLNFNVVGEAEVYFTPQLVRLNYRNLGYPNWYYFFVGDYLDLTPGSTTTLSLGGPLSANLKVLAKGTEVQLIVIVEDEFGNMLDFFFPDDGDPLCIPVTLSESGGTPIHHGTLSSQGIGGRFVLPDPVPPSARYSIELDLGPPYGTFDLEGDLFSPDTTYGWEVTDTDHFALHTPLGYPGITAALAVETERAYDVLRSYLGEELAGTVNGYIEPWPASAGWGGTWVWQAWFGGFRWHDPDWPATIFEFVVWHELGHVFQFTGMIHGVECSWFCEPWATYLATLIIEDISGPGIAEWHRMNYRRRLFEFLEGDSIGAIDRMQYLFFYLEDAYGRNIHRQLAHWWGDPSYPDARGALSAAGLVNTLYQVSVLYSYLAGENLGWVFRLAGFEVPPDVVIDAGVGVVADLAAVHPGILQLDSASRRVSECCSHFVLEVERAGGTAGAITVDYSALDGTATNDEDYRLAGGTLSWADGDRSTRTIVPEIVCDDLTEGSETFTVVLTNPTGGASVAPVLGESVTTIENAACSYVLSHEVLDGVESYEACRSISVGPDVQIVAPGAVVLTAGESVVLSNGVSVGAGAALEVRIETELSQ